MEPVAPKTTVEGVTIERKFIEIVGFNRERVIWKAHLTTNRAEFYGLWLLADFYGEIIQSFTGNKGSMPARFKRVLESSWSPKPYQFRMRTREDRI